MICNINYSLLYILLDAQTLLIKTSNLQVIVETDTGFTVRLVGSVRQ